jgi:restriction system protein
MNDADWDPHGRFGTVTLTPVEFEHLVASTLRKQGVGLKDFSVKHLDTLTGTDGAYKIDVSARFEAFGANFLVLIECKHERRRVEREVVQVLVDKVRSIGAHKGMIFSTAGFQRGALEYARAHGVALVRVADGRTSFETRSANPMRSPAPWLPQYVGWLTQINRDGNESCAYLGEVDVSSLAEAFEPRTL